jgi:hypothetical protein
MEGITISALIGKIKEVVDVHPDTRHGNNLVYQLIDAVSGAFPVFFIHSPSFLVHQEYTHPVCISLTHKEIPLILYICPIEEHL